MSDQIKDASSSQRECHECDGCGVRTCGSGPMCGAPCGKCSGAGVSAESLREARVQGMREARQIVRVNMHIDTACADILRAIEAVRKGER